MKHRVLGIHKNTCWQVILCTLFLTILMNQSKCIADEFSLVPQFVISTLEQQTQYNSSFTQNSGQQTMQLGIAMNKRNITTTHQLNAKLGLARINNGTTYSTINRSISYLTTKVKPTTKLSLSIANNAYAIYENQISSISISNSQVESNTTPLSISLKKSLNSRYSVTFAGSYLYADSFVNNQQLYASDSRTLSASTAYQLNKLSGLNLNLTQQAVNYRKSDVNINSTSLSFGGYKSISAKSKVNISLGVNRLQQKVYNHSVSQYSLNGKLNVNFQTSARASSTISINKQQTTTSYGNFVDLSIIKLSTNLNVSKKHSAYAYFTVGQNKDQVQANNIRNYFQLGFGGSQIITRKISISEQLFYGKESQPEAKLAYKNWGVSIQWVYTPKIIL